MYTTLHHLLLESVSRVWMGRTESAAKKSAAALLATLGTKMNRRSTKRRGTPQLQQRSKRLPKVWRGVA
jgi:hypothetical protein